MIDHIQCDTTSICRIDSSTFQSISESKVAEESPSSSITLKEQIEDLMMLVEWQWVCGCIKQMLGAPNKDRMKEACE